MAVSQIVWPLRRRRSTTAGCGWPAWLAAVADGRHTAARTAVDRPGKRTRLPWRNQQPVAGPGIAPVAHQPASLGVFLCVTGQQQSVAGPPSICRTQSCRCSTCRRRRQERNLKAPSPRGQCQSTSTGRAGPVRPGTRHRNTRAWPAVRLAGGGARHCGQLSG